MLKQYLEVVLYKTYADLRAENQRSYMGFLWWIFEPIMYMSVFYVVFALALQNNDENFVPFLLVGLTIWQWMKSCLTHGSESILNNSQLMQHVYLPKAVFPTISIFTNSVKFLFIFLLLMLYLWSEGFVPTQHYFALPLVLLVELLFIVSVTYLMAAIVPFIPDVRFILENFLQAVFFMSGIFFTVEKIPERYQDWFYLNPMANLIEAFRDILMYQQWPDFSSLAIISLLSLLVMGIAMYLLRRFEYVYPKISI